MQIHIVARTVKDTRSDSHVVEVVGAYRDEYTADTVKSIVGLRSSVERVTLDALPPGFQKLDAERLGLPLSPVSALGLPPDWNTHVLTAWKGLREHNQTIPDEVLDRMRDILLSYPQIG